MPRIGGETGFIILTGAVAISAWIGGLTGGLTATVVAGIANAAIFVGPDGASVRADDRSTSPGSSCTSRAAPSSRR